MNTSEAIRRGVKFLRSAQLPDGSFESFVSTTASPFRPGAVQRTTFTQALILGAITSIDNAAARDVRTKLATWLLAQKSPGWSFNYWAADAPERQHTPYPDDLDDTCCALIALHQHNPSLVGQDALASAVKLLIAAETTVGGPYRTWMVAADAPSAWHDVDLAVNANIAGFLRLVADPLPSLTSLMEQAIAARAFHSPYYPSGYPIIYYIARAYDGPLAPSLAQHLIGKCRGGWWSSPLNSALAVASLVRLGRADACAEAAEQLLASQLSDGSWPAEAFWIDRITRTGTHYSGAAALTTALAVEALAALQPAAKPHRGRPETTNQVADKLCGQIEATLEQDTKHLGTALKHQTRRLLGRTLLHDKNREIRLLPYLFAQSTSQPPPEDASKLFIHLGVANMFGWAAYTAYDDFLDGSGDPSTLSAANICLRYSVQHFRQALPDSTQFQTHVGHVFDIVDSANAWELEHCRMPATNKTITIAQLPTYASTLGLADRSLGHTLGPLGMLAASGITPDDPRAKLVSLALRHYIAARQLNDDLHDWEQDVRAGIITYVVSQILNALSIQSGTYRLAKLTPRMQKEFWYHTVPATCRTIARHTALARSAAAKSGLLKPTNIVTTLTQKIDASVERTLREQSQAEEFLAAYSGTTPKVYTQSSPGR